jgi:hypothetical protein
MNMIRTYSVLLAVLLAQAVQAQKKTNSIFSAYGIGDYDMRDNNAYYGMGATGAALPSDRSINTLNPAALADIAGYRLQLELGISGRQTSVLTGSNERLTTGDLGMKRAAVGLNLVNRVGTAFTLKRLSEVEYLTSGIKGLNGTTTTYPVEIEGSGGLYEAAIQNGVNLTKNLQLGFSLGYLFGSVNRKQTIATTASSAVVVEDNDYYNHLSFNSGLLYRFNTGKIGWALGGTFQPGLTLNKTNDNYIKDQSGNILNQNETKTSGFRMPVKWSAGLAAGIDRWRLTADYIRQNWSATGYKGVGFTTRDAGSLAGGISYQLTKKSYYGLEDGLTFYGGFIHEKSYLDFYSYRLTSTAGTAGVTFPTMHGLYRFSLGLKVGERGTAVYPLVKETFAELLLNISLNTFMLKGGHKYN